MVLHQEMTTIHRLYEDVLNAGDLDLARELIAVKAVDHTSRASSSLPIASDVELTAFLDELCTAFPDVYWAVETITARGNTLVVRTAMSGSHHGEFRGLRPTGRAFTLHICGRSSGVGRTDRGHTGASSTSTVCESNLGTDGRSIAATVSGAA